MAQISLRKIQAKAQVEARKAMQSIMLDASQQIAGVLTRYAVDGIVPVQDYPRVIRDAGRIVSRVFYVDEGQSFINDLPVSPLAIVISRWSGYTVIETMKQHEAQLRRVAPPDVFQWLYTAQRPIEFTELSKMDQQLARIEMKNALTDGDNAFRHVIGESIEGLFNPFAVIDPARQWVPFHKWTDANGYQLSDRIWEAGDRTRRKIDMYLMDALRRQTNVSVIARELEQFLVPGRKNLRTRKPYGTNASYDAMRLVRSEIARAHNHAAYTAAVMNPYVESVDIARSGNGDPTCKICPQYVTIDIYGGRVREPYSLDEAILPIFHPHCVCLVLSRVTQTPAQVTQDLIDYRDAGQQPYINPANAFYFARLLLGAMLFDIAQGATAA